MADDQRLGAVAEILRSGWFQWGTIIALPLTLGGLILSLPPVQDRIFGKYAAVDVELVSEIPVFDMRRPLEGLRVEFTGQDLTASRKNVIASQIQLRNVGDVSITPSNTTSIDPLGFHVTGGQVVRVGAMRANTDHLRRLAKPSFSNNSVHISSDVILDPGDFVRFDLLILKPVDAKLVYKPLGKVEGIRQIGFSSVATRVPQRGRLRTAVEGDIFVHLIRLILYFLAALIMLGVTITATIQIGNIRNRQKDRRRKQIAGFIIGTLSSKIPYNVQVMVGDVYKAHGIAALLYIKQRLALHPSPPVFPLRDRFSLPIDAGPSAREYILMNFDRTLRDFLLQSKQQGYADLTEKAFDPILIEAIDEFLSLVPEIAASLGWLQDATEPDPQILRMVESSVKANSFPGTGSTRRPSAARRSKAK